jgi:hypothetical protein
MGKRLHVLLEDDEFDAIRDVALREGMTMSAWVRQVLRAAWRDRQAGDQTRKLATVRAAARHAFPTVDIDYMLAEIEQGYLR